jgi:hypothetical protein
MSDFQNASWQDASGLRGGKSGTASPKWRVAQLYFPTAGASLDDQDESMLDALVTAFGPLMLGKSVRFQCVGGADAVGAASANQALGLRRAQAVQAALAARFRSMNTFQSDPPASIGESQAGGHTSATDMAGDRRVDILASAVISAAAPAPPRVDARLAVRDAILKARQIVPRKTWGQFKPILPKLESDWDYHSIVIHHSGNWGVKVPREIENLHMLKHGWPDVGYHYLIHPDGKIYEGRSILHKGSHVARANTGRIGLLMMGDYDAQWWDFDDTLTKKHLGTLQEMIATLKKHFGGVKYLGGHIEFALANGDERTCPGSQLIEQLPKLRKESGLSAPAAP